jgi:protein O-GlcNAc transferase
MSASEQVIAAALAAIRAGNPQAALPPLRRLVQKEPANAAANHALGQTLLASGQFDQACHYLQRAAEARPPHPSHLNNYAVALLKLRRASEAIEPFRRAIALKPDYLPAHTGLAAALLMLDDPDAAADAARAALALKPDDPSARESAISAFLKGARLADAVELCRTYTAGTRPDLEALSLITWSLNFEARDPRQVFDAHVHFGRAAAEQFPPDPTPFSNSRDSNRRIRLAYLSSDLRAHSVAYFLAPLLQHHDRAQVEVCCYMTAPPPQHDGVTSYLRSLADRWTDVSPLDPEALHQRLRADRIDIIVELNGHTKGMRLPTLSRRSAPVQATYIGYPNTTGVAEIDHRIVDEITDPAAPCGAGVPPADSLATETLIRLPRCFLSFLAPRDAADPGGPPCSAHPTSDIRLPTFHITFGSFNNLFKISDEAADLWIRLLNHVPGSRLLLKDWPLSAASVRERILQRFESRGLPRSRLTLLPPAAAVADHLAAYRQVDIALDPFPYNGTTTTCEALWMGVPVITLAGTTHASRVGASLLTAVGLPELIARDQDAFVATAAALARDIPRLTHLRRTLRDQVRASPLCDAPSLCRALESAYRTMWRSWAG